MKSTVVSLGETTMISHATTSHSADTVELIWAHGWGQSSAAFVNLAETFQTRCSCQVLDLPGFGSAGLPPETWGTANYADAIATWLATAQAKRRIWIGHSFGCRIGLQLAARRPELISAMVLISAAGLRRKRSFLQLAILKTRIYSYKLLKNVVPEGALRGRLRSWFSSTDGRTAGALRNVFIRVVNEDLTGVAAAVQCPVVLIYGRDDIDTPPEIGVRLNRLIRNSKLVLLQGFDHHNILSQGRHQVANEILRLLEAIDQ